MTLKSYTATPDTEILKDVGRRLRALRGSLNQTQAAKQAGLTRQTVSRAERGDNPNDPHHRASPPGVRAGECARSPHSDP